jgi:predicted transcriptional regulator
MQIIKEKVIQILNNLPDNATYDDIMEAIYVQQKVSKGIEQIENGQYINHEEMRNRLKKWLQ